MSLRRYLLVSYAISVILLTVGMVGLDSSAKTGVPFGGIVAIAAVTALANVFVNILPWASKVPKERRSSFWSYRATNIFMAAVGSLIVFSAIIVLIGV